MTWKQYFKELSLIQKKVEDVKRQNKNLTSIQANKAFKEEYFIQNSCDKLQRNLQIDCNGIIMDVFETSRRYDQISIPFLLFFRRKVSPLFMRVDIYDSLKNEIKSKPILTRKSCIINVDSKNLKKYRNLKKGQQVQLKLKPRLEAIGYVADDYRKFSYSGQIHSLISGSRFIAEIEVLKSL